MTIKQVSDWALPMLNFQVPDLKITPRDGGNARGQEGLELILNAALSVLIHHGYKSLTMRRIATECGMKPGNLSYYFKSKDELVRTLLDAIMASYEDSFKAAMAQAGTDPEKRLENLIQLILEDIMSKKTTHIFPELWSLSNHDQFVKDRLYELYSRQYTYFEELIRQINPSVSKEDEKMLSAFITAALEGMTVFAGYNKPWREKIPRFEEMACQCFVDLIKNLKSHQEPASSLNPLDEIHN